MVVDKNALLMRDGNGNVLPMTLNSDVFGGEVRILPLKQGDFNELKEKGSSDIDIIVKFLYEPKLTEDEAKELPMASQKELIKLILMSSGMTREEVDMSMKQGIEEMNERLKKK